MHVILSTFNIKFRHILHNHGFCLYVKCMVRIGKTVVSNLSVRDVATSALTVAGRGHSSFGLFRSAHIFKTTTAPNFRLPIGKNEYNRPGAAMEKSEFCFRGDTAVQTWAPSRCNTGADSCVWRG